MLRTLSRVEVEERMTADDFLRFGPDDKADLIEGVIVVSPPPLDIHERVVIFLLRLITEYVELKDMGEVRGSRTAVVLDDEHVFEPDLLFVTHERAEIIKEKGVFGAPDFVIEIISAGTATYDRGAKFRVYGRAGVRELWLIDPYGPAGTEFYQLEGDRLRPIMPDEAGVVHSIALPGFKLNTAWLWPAEKFIPIREALRAMDAE